MDRELLKKAREIENKIDTLERVLKTKKSKSAHLSAIIIEEDDFNAIRLPDELMEDVFNIIKKHKTIYEKQLEEL